MTDLACSLKDSLCIMDDVATKISGVRIHDLPENRRLQIAGALFQLAIDHGQGIVVLVRNECYSSALALQRLCFEAFAKGMWVRWCITDTEVIEIVEAMKDGKHKFHQMERIVTEIETSEAWPSKVFKNIKQEFWPHWCGLVHGGVEQIVLQWSKSGIASNHDPDEIQQALHWANFWQLLSATQFAIAADDESLLQHFVGVLESIGAIDSAS